MNTEPQMNRSAALWRTAALPIAVIALAASALPAHAHHVMGGRTPSTWFEGFASGLGHPIIGIDHAAFIVALGLVAAMARLPLLMPAVFVALSAAGVALHVQGIDLPAAELAIGASVVVVGAMLAIGRRIAPPGWIGLFAIAGVLHGYAYGESIVGAQPGPLSAYLAGLVLVQSALAAAVAFLARNSAAEAIKLRLIGAVVAGIGLAVLAGHVVPA